MKGNSNNMNVNINDPNGTSVTETTTTTTSSSTQNYSQHEILYELMPELGNDQEITNRITQYRNLR